jgi:hypothetical protein
MLNTILDLYKEYINNIDGLDEKLQQMGLTEDQILCILKVFRTMYKKIPYDVPDQLWLNIATRGSLQQFLNLCSVNKRLFKHVPELRKYMQKYSTYTSKELRQIQQKDDNILLSFAARHSRIRVAKLLYRQIKDNDVMGPFSYGESLGTYIFLLLESLFENINFRKRGSRASGIFHTIFYYLKDPKIIDFLFFDILFIFFDMDMDFDEFNKYLKQVTGRYVVTQVIFRDKHKLKELYIHHLYLSLQSFIYDLSRNLNNAIRQNNHEQVEFLRQRITLFKIYFAYLKKIILIHTL